METIKKRRDFLRVQRGPKWVTPAFVLQALPREQTVPSSRSEPPRFGFTVSSRSVATERDGQRRRGTAVARNRARRRLKEAVRLIGPEAAQPGFDYVIIGRPLALTRNFAQLLDDLRSAFHKVALKRDLTERAGPGGNAAQAPFEAPFHRVDG